MKNFIKCIHNLILCITIFAVVITIFNFLVVSPNIIYKRDSVKFIKTAKINGVETRLDSDNSTIKFKHSSPTTYTFKII